MRLFISVVIYNILLIGFGLYIIFFSNNEIKMHYMNDLSGLTEEESIKELEKYEISIEYIESPNEKNTVVYTNPTSKELVCEGQMIVLYISKGYQREKVKSLVNQLYSDSESYLKSLINDYKAEVVIKYVLDDDNIDGLITEQKTSKEYLDDNMTIELTIISNPKTVVIPDFSGWYYKEVIKFGLENMIEIEFEYISILYPKDYVVGQSIDCGTVVLKRNTTIIIYLSKEI